MEKKNLLLIVPKLDQGGLERVCVRTARILSPRFRVTIAAFDPSDPAYDLTGLDVRDLKAPALPGRAGKVWRLLQRAVRLVFFLQFAPAPGGSSFFKNTNFIQRPNNLYIACKI